MSVEVLAQLQPENISQLREVYCLFPISIAWIGWLWKKLKDERRERDGDPDERLEVDHKHPRYKGGTDDEENLQALTLPEHAMKHFRAHLAEKDKESRHNEARATGAIVSRMTPEEYKEFMRRLKDEQK